MSIIDYNLDINNTKEEENNDRPCSYQSDSTNATYSYRNNNGSFHNRLEEQYLSPTQASCLMTTVPQNIATRSLGEKHAPTRNSLRHSRMIVMYRNGRVPKKYLPFVIKHYKLVKSMKVITIILGILMSLVSIWLVLWGPTLTTIYFTYWSAAPVFCSGVVGCYFLGFCPRPYPGRTLGCHYHLTKFVSLFTTSVSVLASLIVLIICIIHLVYIHTATCVPHDKLNTTCVCSVSKSTNSFFNDSYHYEDFTCEEVDCLLIGIVATACVLNILAIILETLYLFVHWNGGKKYVYAKVPISECTQIEEIR